MNQRCFNRRKWKRERATGYGFATTTALAARWICPTLAGRGVFAAWNDRAFFEAVCITPYRAIAWGNDIDICADALYMRLTGKTVEELMPGVRDLLPHA